MARPKRQQPVSLQRVLNQFYGGLLSPKEQRAQARKDTNLALQDSMRDLRRTYQTERERTLREQYAQGTYAGMLRGFGAPGSAESQQIRDAYAKAAGLNERFSQGLIESTTGQQGANVGTSAAQNAQLAGYEGPAIPGADAGVNASVLSYLNSLPKGTFAAQAEARAAGLASAGAAAASPFALREAQLGQTLREMSDKYTMARQDINAKRASSFQEALSGLRESGRGDLATLINAMYLQNTMGKTQAELTGTYKGKPTLEAQLAKQEQALKAQIAAADTWQEKQNLGIKLMNARTSRMQAQVASRKADIAAASASGDVTKTEQTFRTNAKKWVEGLLNVNKTTGLPRTPMSKQALINGIVRTYGQPLFGQYGKGAVVAWATAVVNSFPASYFSGKKGKAGKGGGKGGGGTKPVTELP
jgi:hypothetical protein